MSNLHIGIAYDGIRFEFTKNDGEVASLFVNQEAPEDTVTFFNRIAPYLGITVTSEEEY